MRLAFFGDIVGRSGRSALMTHLPGLRRRLKLDFVVADAENIAAGFGVTEALANGLYEAGVDCITLGNHAWDQREAMTYIEREPRLLRPVNYPRLSQAPGKGAWVYDVPAGRVLVVCALGHRGMDALDEPFSAVDAALEACPLGVAADAVIIEIHAEATSEKMAMGHFCDGRASLVVGAHTHIPTADAQILPGGTAYQTDAGACCDYDSVIGMEKQESVRRFVTKLPGERHRPAEGPGTACGVFVETHPTTGLARRVEPIRIGGRLLAHVPEV